MNEDALLRAYGLDPARPVASQAALGPYVTVSDRAADAAAIDWPLGAVGQPVDLSAELARSVDDRRARTRLLGLLPTPIITVADDGR